MGGTNDPKNLKELTVKQHAAAHKKLYKKHGKWEDRIAWQMLSGQITNYEAKQQVRRLANLGNTNFAGHTHTKEVRRKISEYQKMAKLGNQYRLGKTFTTKSREKISESLKGNSNKLGKTGAQKKKFEGKRTWLIGDNNPAKRPEVREKLRQAALKRYSI
tara:strand:- start:41 stop:520 length:480 start_codon:yes stop_codon:yes gene_type:complete